MDWPIGQSYGGVFSIKTPSSKMGLTSMKLTKPNQDSVCALNVSYSVHVLSYVLYRTQYMLKETTC